MNDTKLKNNENLEQKNGSNNNGLCLDGICNSCLRYDQLENGSEYCNKCFSILMNEINKANRELKIEATNLWGAVVFLTAFYIYCGFSMPIYIDGLLIATIIFLAIWGTALLCMKYQIKNSSNKTTKERKNR